MKPIRYIISKAWKPNGLSNQSEQFLGIMDNYLSSHVIRRWHRTFRGKEHFGFISLALNRLAPLKKANGEILHASNLDVVPHICDPLQIVEVWDLIPFKRLWEHQDKLFKSMYYCSFIPGVVSAEQVVTHTKAVQKEVKELIDRDSIVIPAGIDAHRFRIMENVKKEENSILCVSGHYAHKNMLNLIRACGIASMFIDSEIHLRIVGPETHESVSMMNQIAERYSKLNIEHIGFVSQEMLIEFYNLSSLYCSFSLSEGFGLTPIEAMACGTVPILSNIDVHKEVCGDYAFYVDALNSESAGDTIAYVLQEEGITGEYAREESRKHAKKYDWCNIIPQWMNLYRKFGIEFPYPINHEGLDWVE